MKLPTTTAVLIMDPVDLEIRKRLDKLKEDRPPVPSEEELRLRLQKLKGERPCALSNKYVLLPCVKSDEEQVNDLMKQYSEETTLQQRFTTPVHDIEQRLNNLKMFQISSGVDDLQKKNKTKQDQNSRASKENILRKLDEKVPAMTSDDQNETMDYADSYPQEYFCYICDRVPKRICYTCDDQLFCPACFKEYHEDEDEPHKWRLFNIRRTHPDSDSD